MKKGKSKDAVVVLDRWTKRRIARYPSVAKAAEDLGISPSGIYVAICFRQVSHECYWVYESKLPDWQPAVRRHVKTRGSKYPDKLKVLIENEGDL